MRSKIRKHCLPALSVLLCILASVESLARPVRIAVAANFRAPMYAIAKQYKLQSDDTLQITVSSSGKLYAQIRQGAPFDLFFSADSTKPARLEKENRIVPGSRFIYAQGRLVIWSANAEFNKADMDIKAHLNQLQGKIAIANPLHAPYGLAAKQSLVSLGVYAGLEDQLVYGENISQVFNFTAVGGINTAFLALSQVQHFPLSQYWLIPQRLHQPINQEAVLLNEGNEAQKFLRFFRSSASAQLIESFGYRVTDESFPH